MLAVVAALMSPACRSDPCDEVALTETSAADLATSCPETVEYEGRRYGPWCVGVRSELLGTEVELRGSDVNTEYRARFIAGIPPEQALAVWTRFPHMGRESTLRLQRHCGTWRFAPAGDLERDEAERIAKDVTVPGTLRLN